MIVITLVFYSAYVCQQRILLMREFYMTYLAHRWRSIYRSQCIYGQIPPIFSVMTVG